MVAVGLSENRLLRELGHLHLAHLFKHLNVSSDDYVDAHNRRIYPTFARIRIEANRPLRAMQENDLMLMSNHMLHLANGNAISQTSIEHDSLLLHATCLTIDDVRNDFKQALTRGTPLLSANIQGNSDVEQYHRRLQQGSVNKHTLLSHRFTLENSVNFETVYTINPHHNIDGINQIYFTTYQTIHDACERQYIHAHCSHLMAGNWADMASTLARDVFFFSNCSVNDRVIVRLYEIKRLSSDQMAFHSCLYRKSDGRLMAILFTIKQINLS